MFGYRERAVHPQDDWTAHACHFIHSANLSSDKREPNMTDTPAYTPPEVWVWEKDDSPKWRYSNLRTGQLVKQALSASGRPMKL